MSPLARLKSWWAGKYHRPESYHSLVFLMGRTEYPWPRRALAAVTAWLAKNANALILSVVSTIIGVIIGALLARLGLRR